MSGTLQDVSYRILDSPLGLLLVAATPVGLVRVAFEREGFDSVLDTLRTTIGPRIHHTPHQLKEVAGELEEYFDGNRRTFDLPLDFSLSAPSPGRNESFRRMVQRYLPQIGYGTTRSYREVAEAVGHPTASRAVGTACATNPLPVVVPCHRVLRSDGSLGGYLGGPEAKTTLLELERTTTGNPA